MLSEIEGNLNNKNLSSEVKLEMADFYKETLQDLLDQGTDEDKEKAQKLLDSLE